MSDPNDSQSTVSVLGPTLCLKGDLSVDEDLVILGSVEGNLHASSSDDIKGLSTAKAEPAVV